MALTPDGRQIVSGSFDQEVRVLDLATAQLVRTVAYPGPVWSVSVTPDGRQLVAGGGARDNYALRV